MMQYLNQNTEKSRMGIYWSGTLGPNQGTLYLGSAAVNNEHYTPGRNVAHLGEFGWMNIKIESFSFGSSQVPTSGCGRAGSCVLDTGTPVLMVPSQILWAINQRPYGALTITLGGGVNLEFDVATLHANNYMAAGEQQYILGLPLWASYYTVFDIKASTVEFVQKSTTGSQKLAPRAAVVV